MNLSPPLALELHIDNSGKCGVGSDTYIYFLVEVLGRFAPSVSAPHLCFIKPTMESLVIHAVTAS